MKVRRTVGLLAVLVLVGGMSGYFWKKAEPRRNAIGTLRQFNDALSAGDSTKILGLVSIPTALAGRTAAEQSEFLSKALHDEISAEGLAVLQREGQFGPLTNLFPAEASTWAKSAGVSAEGCVAFKLEKNGQRAEVVLARVSDLVCLDPGAGGRRPDEVPPSLFFKLVRCNNVKQLALQ